MSDILNSSKTNRSDVTEKLISEAESVKGIKIYPLYYKGIGYLRTDESDDEAVRRAAAVRTLFCDSEPYIYKNDLIAGSIKSLTVKDGTDTKECENKAKEFRDRGFWSNADHYSPNYSRFMSEGITGYLDRIEKSLSVHKNDADKVIFLESCKTTMLAMREMILNYSKKAKSLIGCVGYDDEALKFIIANCEAITKRAPESFAEALQLLWFAHTCFGYERRYAMALGRMDRYLYPFYKRDKASGKIDDETVIKLLENIFVKIHFRDDIVNIAIGGIDEDGVYRVNELSYLILYAVRNVSLPGPNLSARVSSMTDEVFLDECLKVIGTGLGYPAIMNDDVNIPALSLYGYDRADIYDYSMVGCIENFITGKQRPWSDGRFDAPRYIEDTINLCLDAEKMSEFLAEYEKRLKVEVKNYADYFNENNSTFDKIYVPMPFISCFCDDCIERGIDINYGGAKYKSVHGMVAMGLGTTVDSLSAIEKCVFCDKEFTMRELSDALKNNFDGYENIRKALTATPKYGNDNDFADKYAQWFIDFLYGEISKYRTPDGGYFYLAMAANVANVISGRTIGATPDGRLAGEPLSDAASPSYGKDTLGFTAVINSITKADYKTVSCGSVINQKFSPSMFSDESRKKLVSALKVYLAKGGQEMQINATSRETLSDAMENPDRYRGLVVRVSGFSALYVDLERDVQLDILARTEHK